MKKIIICSISLCTFFIATAQEIKTTIVVDSAQIKMDASKTIIENKQAQLKSDLKDQKEIRAAQKKADKQATAERRELAKQEKQLKRDQRDVQIENKRIDKINESVNKENKLKIKLNKRLIDANEDLVKIQSKFEKAKSKRELTPVDKSEFELKITKQQLKVREIEEDIAAVTKNK